MQARGRSGSWLRFGAAETLERFGAAVSVLLEPGDAVCLFGPLGAGKSTFARGLIRAMTHAGQDVPSPTFTLMQVYEGPKFPVAHFDLYRLKRPEEALELGLDEALDVGAAVVEWSERLEDALPPERLEIRLAMQPPSSAVDAAVDARWGCFEGVGRWREKAVHL